MNEKTVVIIPAYNEEETVAEIVSSLLDTKTNLAKISEVIVVDNKSTDNTAYKASKAGARVVYEEELGYGAACLAGVKAIKSADIVLFIDADGSDSPEEWPSLVRPIIEGNYDLVIGSREASKETLLPHQRFGNWLATRLLYLVYSTKFTDLGPFRAIKFDAFKKIQMSDRDYGWTVQMQIKALRHNLKCTEVPVSYGKRKGGQSKVAGSIEGSLKAGVKILYLVFAELISSWMENFRIYVKARLLRKTSQRM